jgi:hypothetical protein
LANGFLVEANMEFGRACREISERAAHQQKKGSSFGTTAAASRGVFYE